MSNTSAPPSLEQYPGYFPAAKPPFWTRTKVGAASGVVGLLMGALVGSVADSDPAKPAADLSETVEALEQDVADTQAELRQQEEESQAALDEAEAALVKAKADAKAAQKKAVADAVAAEKSRQEAEETTPDLNGFVGTTRPPDQRFETCDAARAAGYGPYLRGIDPEFAWYPDTDNDGLACES